MTPSSIALPHPEDLIPPIVLEAPVAMSQTEALQSLTVTEALEKARKVLKEIGTFGGDYGHFGFEHGNLVFDATQAEAALRFAAAKIGGSQRHSSSSSSSATSSARLCSSSASSC